ncbi:MAG TPA: hypothetical protein VLB72_10045 [Burkholderiales bacterium]|nr:hypothetical protein [Burkholderiales bacterium]
MEAPGDELAAAPGDELASAAAWGLATMSGQFDGDGPSRSDPFARAFGQQPWLRGAVTPWHMWGTLETLTIPIDPPGPARQVSQQLSRVNYRRPDTWHWLFYCRIVQAPVESEGNSIIVAVDFNCIFGLGRASVTLPGFQRLVFNWTAPAPAPVEPLWSTRALSPDDEGQGTEQMVAEDIQCSSLITVSTVNVPLTPALIIEVGSFFAPKNHIRPDWLQLDQSIEAQFPGSEIQGR